MKSKFPSVNPNLDPVTAREFHDEICPVELIRGLIFHVVAGAGTLACHVKQLTGKHITDGALSQRRALLPLSILKRRLLEVYPDGSALVQIRSGGKTRLVREILARVQRGTSRKFTTVRLWTSLLDWRRYPAAELAALERVWKLGGVLFSRKRPDGEARGGSMADAPL